jgi:hypothetical protein
VDAHLVEHDFEVVLHGVPGDVQGIGDAAGWFAAQDEGGDLCFAGGQAVRGEQEGAVPPPSGPPPTRSANSCGPTATRSAGCGPRTGNSATSSPDTSAPPEPQRPPQGPSGRDFVPPLGRSRRRGVIVRLVT